MNHPVLSLALLGALGAASAQGVPGALDHTSISGKDYASLTDWARDNRYQFNRNPGSEIVQLTTPSSRLTFAVDSQRADLNGVAVYLSLPIASRGGDIWISSLDLQSTIRPILFPIRSPRAIPVVNICLDPGHGGKDPGNEEGRHKEKEYTLLLALEVRKLLTAEGVKVTLTRQTDSFVPLPDRPEIAGRRLADLFVSLHFNAAIANKDEVKGVEVYCLTPAGARSTHAHGDSGDTSVWAGNAFDAKNVLLAYQIQKSLIRELPVLNRGVKRARFAVLRTARMPAVLIEAGFMSHSTESKKVFDSAYRRQLARAIVDGILAYKKATEP
jgi:N-acetylmuramoyl-L-alanine amidase